MPVSDRTYCASNSAFSRAALDPNPLHLDADIAAASRFGGLIASGTQSIAWLLGSLGTWVLERCPSLGLDCDFKLRRAVPADRLAVITWHVVSVSPKPSLNGHIMRARGTLCDPQGEVMVAANASILLLRDLGPPHAA